MSVAASNLRLPRAALGHLRRADPALGRLIAHVGPCRLQVGYIEGRLSALVRAIVFQQLSTKAASTIYQRLRDQFDKARFPTAEELLVLPPEVLRSAGISNQKQGYLRDLCERVRDHKLDLDKLHELDDAEVIDQLTTVRGIGRWSAQMFLMFELGRLDVWPDGDLGIRSAVQILHNHPELPSPKIVAQTGARYRPYGTVASWYLWRLCELPAEERENFRGTVPVDCG